MPDEDRSVGGTARPSWQREVAAFADALNDIDNLERAAFGDAVNAAIVRNVKAATLSESSVSIRGLGRVLGLEPSTVRRRVAKLVDAGWLVRDGDDRLRYSPESLARGQELTRRALARFARMFRDMERGREAPRVGPP